MANVKLLLLQSNTWNPLTVCKKKKEWTPAHLIMLSTKCVYKSYVFKISV